MGGGGDVYGRGAGYLSHGACLFAYFLVYRAACVLDAGLVDVV